MEIVVKLQEMLPSATVKFVDGALFINDTILSLGNWKGEELESFHSLTEGRKNDILLGMKAIVGPMLLVTKPIEPKVEVKKEVVETPTEKMPVFDKVVTKPKKKLESVSLTDEVSNKDTVKSE
jgi:hypothetical protein